MKTFLSISAVSYVTMLCIKFVTNIKPNYFLQYGLIFFIIFLLFVLAYAMMKQIRK